MESKDLLYCSEHKASNEKITCVSYAEALV